MKISWFHMKKNCYRASTVGCDRCMIAVCVCVCWHTNLWLNFLLLRKQLLFDVLEMRVRNKNNILRHAWNIPFGHSSTSQPSNIYFFSLRLHIYLQKKNVENEYFSWFCCLTQLLYTHQRFCSSYMSLYSCTSFAPHT